MTQHGNIYFRSLDRVFLPINSDCLLELSVRQGSIRPVQHIYTAHAIIGSTKSIETKRRFGKDNVRTHDADKTDI